MLQAAGNGGSATPTNKSSPRITKPKLSVWSDRYAEVNRTSPGRFSSSLGGRRPPIPYRDRSRGRDDFQSHPVSPAENKDFFSGWILTDIDFGEKRDDGFFPPPAQGCERIYRTRSRHDCHFSPGTPFLAGKEKTRIVAQLVVFFKALLILHKILLSVLLQLLNW